MQEIVMSREEIEQAAERIADSLSERLKDDEKIPVFLAVMRGALYFMAELRKRMKIPSFDSYVHLQSYSGTQSTGKIKNLHDPEIDLNGRTVVIVEDVVDTGLSMDYLKKHLFEIAKPKQVLLVALFDKACARKVPVEVDYSGKVLNENKFLLGFGLDYNGLCRNSDFVYIPTPEDIKEMDEILAKRG